MSQSEVDIEKKYQLNTYLDNYVKIVIYLKKQQKRQKSYSKIKNILLKY